MLRLPITLPPGPLPEADPGFVHRNRRDPTHCNPELNQLSSTPSSFQRANLTGFQSRHVRSAALLFFAVAQFLRLAVHAATTRQSDTLPLFDIFKNTDSLIIQGGLWCNQISLVRK